MRKGFPNILPWKYLLAIIVAAIMLFPIYWMLVTSFKPLEEAITLPPTFFPKHFLGLTNYTEVFRRAPFANFLFNSVVACAAVTFGTIFTSCLAGYIFAKYNFWGRDIIFSLVLATIMVPLPVILIPLFLLMISMQLANNILSLIIPFLVSGFGIFLMRQYIHTIPSDLIDAARIDGCSEFEIFFIIIFPLCKTAMAAIGIYTFMIHWSRFLWPLVVISDVKRTTLAVGIALISERFGVRDYTVFMAGASLIILPALITFLLGQRYFIKGMILSGLKG